MARVLLDGEQVNFEGPPPRTALGTWTLIETFLEQSNLIVDRFLVDGVVWDAESGKDQDCYDTIEVFSMPIAQNLYNTVTGLLEQQNQILELWRDGAQVSLSTPWTVFQSQAMAIFLETQAFVQCVSLLSEYSKNNELTWAKTLMDAGEELNVGLSTAIDAFDSANCIGFSDAAAVEVISGLKRVYQVLSEEVIPSLDYGGNR